MHGGAVDGEVVASQVVEVAAMGFGVRRYRVRVLDSGFSEEHWG
jgi:hypothetical protein